MNAMRERSFGLSRRHFLRGLGACLALPALESLRPCGALAAGAVPARRYYWPLEVIFTELPAFFILVCPGAPGGPRAP